MLGRRPGEVARCTQRAADVLFVQPAVEHPDVQEVGERAGAGGSGPRHGEVVVVAVAQRLQATLDERVPFGEHLRAGEPAPCIDLVLVHLADRVLHVGHGGRTMAGGGQALEHALDADEVRQVVLYGPAGKVGGQLPLRFVEAGTERAERSPSGLELVDGVGGDQRCS